MKSTEVALQEPESEQNLSENGMASLVLMGEDNPLTWSSVAKWSYTLIVVFVSGIVGFSSSVHTPAITAIAEDFNVSRILSTLGASTYLIGFGTGLFIFAPLSELLGRNPVYCSTFLVFCLAQLACALSSNIATFLIFRFIAGFFGSPTVTNAGGSIADLWSQSQRSVPLALFTAASFCGPVLAPISGGFLTQYVSWRWNFWLVLIISGILYVLVVLFLPETYGPKILEKQRKTHKPILFTLSLYMAFIYGILFLGFTIYPVVFQQARGWSLAISSLSFLGIGIGMVFATAVPPLVNNIHGRYVQKLGPEPEARLPHLIIVSWLLPIGLFWFGWTAPQSTPWISSVLAGVPFGFGLVILFLGINTYFIDCFDRFSASALAANTLLRSLFGAGFAVFADSMNKKLGTAWTASVLGFIALAMAPLPLVFHWYGARLRAASKYHLFTVQL